jgi:membrane fusion protein, multidrug efflux system
MDSKSGSEATIIDKSGNNSKSWYAQKRVAIPLILLLILAIAIAVYWYFFIRGYISTDDAYIDSDNVTISSKILGRITQLKCDEGDTIKSDELVVFLDDSDLRAQEMLAKANLEYARKNAELSQTNLNKTRDDFKRADIQYKGNAITREQYEHAQQSLEMAKAQYAASQSQIETAIAQLNVVQTQLGNMQITSTFAGIVAKRWVLEGDVVQAAQPIITIYSTNVNWVTAYLEETKIASIQIGDPVEISIDAYPAQKFNGKVTEIGATAAAQFSLIPPNNASGNFTKVTQRIPVKIAISQANNQYPLRAGMSVEIRIKIKPD